MSNGQMTVAEAGRRGGEAVKAKHGIEHYRAIGRAGGAKVAERGSGFYSAIGSIGGSKVRDLHGTDYYAAIGRKGGEAVRAKHGDDYYARIGAKGGRARKGTGRPTPASDGRAGRTAKVTADQRADIVRRRAAGETLRAIAAAYDISLSYVHYLCRPAA